MTVERSPLAAFAERFEQASTVSDGRLTLAEESLWAQVNVRVEPTEAYLLADALGGPLPSVANTVSSTASGLVVWLGPDEWLVLSPAARPGLDGDLKAAAGTTPVSVVDVSAARTIVAVGGKAARDVLAHGCALDLHASRFPPGSCAQTRLALANVVLIAPPAQSDFSQSPTFYILVRSSFAAYLATWLLDAASEYLDSTGVHDDKPLLTGP